MAVHLYIGRKKNQYNKEENKVFLHIKEKNSLHHKHISQVNNYLPGRKCVAYKVQLEMQGQVYVKNTSKIDTQFIAEIALKSLSKEIQSCHLKHFKSVTKCLVIK